MTYVVMYIMERKDIFLYDYISCVRLLRCPFYSNGQFQSLVVWDGHQ